MANPYDLTTVRQPHTQRMEQHQEEPPHEVPRGRSETRPVGAPEVSGASKYHEIVIAGMIDAQAARDFILSLALHHTHEKRVWICSEGGDVGSALAVHDALARSGVIAVATGMCMSAAVIALLGARRRLATPNTMFYLHDLQPQGHDNDFPEGIPAIKAWEKVIESVTNAGRITLPGKWYLNIGTKRAIELNLIEGILK